MAQFGSIEEAQAFFRKDLYATENGIVLDEYTENGSVCSVELTDHHKNAEGGVMGGVMLTLIDFSFATAACNVHRPTVAQQVSVNFLSGTRGARLIAPAQRHGHGVEDDRVAERREKAEPVACRQRGGFHELLVPRGEELHDG